MGAGMRVSVSWAGLVRGDIQLRAREPGVAIRVGTCVIGPGKGIKSNQIILLFEVGARPVLGFPDRDELQIECPARTPMPASAMTALARRRARMGCSRAR